MNLLSDGHKGATEIELSDSAEGLRELGRQLIVVETTFEWVANQERSKFYPVNLHKLIVVRDRLEQ